MSRILDGNTGLTLEDTMTYRSFDDVIGISGAWTTMLYRAEDTGFRASAMADTLPVTYS